MAKGCYRAVNPDMETVAYFGKLSKAIEWIDRLHGNISVRKEGGPNRLKIVTHDGEYRVIPIRFEI